LAAGDSIGIMSTRDSVVTTPDYSWEKWSDASWHTLLQAWPINCDLYIFVIIDEGPIGIEEAASINGMRMVFRTGNVITDRIDLQFALDNAARTRLVISDLSGRTMLDEDLGQRAPGTHDRNIDASSWSAGTYLVSLISNGKTITKKVVKN
ncbi:MAG: T9SS type A sorting domain-containing protein, partial [Flavobacteriales bacterium]|nr:T9SS type A sorting domain-containing protein [Flavobacteriales bacterium]